MIDPFFNQPDLILRQLRHRLPAPNQKPNGRRTR